MVRARDARGNSQGMEHNDGSPKVPEATELEQRTDVLGEHIKEARAASEQAPGNSDLPYAVGDFNEDSSDVPGGDGVTPETNYTTRGD